MCHWGTRSKRQHSGLSHVGSPAYRGVIFANMPYCWWKKSCTTWGRSIVNDPISVAILHFLKMQILFAGLQGDFPWISPRFHSTTLPERMGFLLNCTNHLLHYIYLIGMIGNGVEVSFLMSFVKLKICLILLQFNERSWLMIDVSYSRLHFVPKIEGTNSVRTSLHPLSNLLPARCWFRSSIYNRFNLFL